MSEAARQIGVLGCGAMGGAMARGLTRTARRDVVVADAVAESARTVAAAVGGRVGEIAEVAACDVVIVAVKPKDAAEALQEVGRHIRPAAIIVSVVAGWDIARISAAADHGAVARIMPNLAVRDGAGLIAYADQGIDSGTREDVIRLLAELGTVEQLPESQFSAATALAGSGPGFVALVAEGLEEGAVAAGFSRDQARRMVQSVLAGSAALLADGTDPAELRHRVSSPGGTTVEGVAVLERGAVRAHVADAVRAAARRATELG